MWETAKQVFGANLGAARRAAEITQAELASRVSLSTESISNLERGKHAPSFETLISLSNELGLSVSDLLDGVGPQDSRSGSRIDLEARTIQQIRGLPDEKLAIALDQLIALASHSNS